MHLLPGILLSLLVDCVQTQLNSADIHTPKLKAHQTVLQFNPNDADCSAANILKENQHADASTSNARESEDVCGLSRYKPFSTHTKRATSTIEYESHQDAKNDDIEDLAKGTSLPEETKERSAENLPDKNRIHLDLQESLSLKNAKESSQFIQARAVAPRPRTRPVKNRWKTRPKFRARTPPRKVTSRPSTKSWLPFKSKVLRKPSTTRKFPSGPPPKTRLPSESIALPKTGTTRKLETARRFRKPPKKTRRKPFLWRPKSGNRKKSPLSSPRNRPNRSLSPQGRIEKPRRTTGSRRVVKSTNPLSIRKKNKSRKKHRSKKVVQNVPDSLKPVQDPSSSLHVVPSVRGPLNGGQRNPTSSDDPSPPQTDPGAPRQPDAIPRNSASSNDPPNVPPSNLNPAYPPSPQTAPLVPPQPNRMQESSNHNGGQDPSASVSNNQISSHLEQENAQPLVTGQDSSRDLEIIQSQGEQEANQIQPTRRRRTSRSRPSRSREIQNHHSATHRSPSQDEQATEEQYEEEVEEAEVIAREMPSNRAPSNRQSKLFHMSDLVFSTINSALPHLLGNAEMRRTRNPDMEDMANGMMGRDDYPGEMGGPPGEMRGLSEEENLYANQGGPDLDPNEGIRDPRARRPGSSPFDGGRNIRNNPMNTLMRPGNIRPQNGIRSRPNNPPSDDNEQENYEEDTDEPPPDPRLTHAPPDSANPREPDRTRIAHNSHSDVDGQKTKDLSRKEASNKTIGKSDKKDNKSAKDHDDDDDDDDLENTYEEQEDDNSEDSSETNSEADPEPGHDKRTKFNSNSNRESKHKDGRKTNYKADSETHHDTSSDMHIEENSKVDREIHQNPLNGTLIEGISNSTHEIKNTTHLEAHPDLSTDMDPEFNGTTDHKALEKTPIDVQTETNHNSTEAQGEKGHNANHETNSENISGNNLISNEANSANNTRDSLSEAMEIDTEEGLNST